jgi:hypothetical protein
MDANELAMELCSQLRHIIGWTNFARVGRVELALGNRYGVTAEQLEEQFEALCDSDRSSLSIADALEGAVLNVRIVAPGETYKVPLRNEEIRATGWDLVVLSITGSES